MRLRELDLASALYLARNLRPADVRELNACRWAAPTPDDLAVEMLRWRDTGYCWVAEHDGLPAAVFGSTQPWPGLFSCYMLATPAFPKVGLGVTKFCRQVFLPHMQERANRIEARSIEGHDHAHRWLRVLGATEEGRLKGYGANGEDFITFTWPAPNCGAIVDRSDSASTRPGRADVH